MQNSLHIVHLDLSKLCVAQKINRPVYSYQAMWLRRCSILVGKYQFFKLNPYNTRTTYVQYVQQLVSFSN